MPIYEYKCQKCGKVTEVFFRSVHEKRDLSCAHCSSKELQKIFSIPSAVLNGKLSDQGTTCCGKTERCDIPPCSTSGVCRKD